MPILPAEPDLYPPDLWQNTVGDVDPERPWWCLHTRPRQEKAVARHLREQRLTYYLPQAIHESRTPGGRKIRSRLPLFTSYLFLQGNDQDRIHALKSNRLVRIIEIQDQPALVGDLRQIHRMLQSGLPVLPEPVYPVGTQIRIISGPLTGLVGTVVRRAKHDRFVAHVRCLGCGASLDLQDWQVEPD